jgi:prepilin-type N-terminal cleavage/methylation domain-containing protein
MKANDCILIKMSKLPRGFGLIEALISMALLCILTLACAGQVASFARYTSQDTIKSCLLQAASSGIEEKRANPAASSITVSCSGYAVSVAITTTGTLPSPAPAMGSGISACVPVLSRSTIGSKTMELRDSICNFPGE